MTARRERIGTAFGQAQDYDRHARVQARVAGALAARIAALPLPQHPRLLELGCGTGHLSEALGARGIGGHWLVTDLSPAMVERARARIGAAPDRAFAVLDGERGAMPGGGGFDLIASSLAFQWFDDPASAAARLHGWLRPGGWLAFTTLGHETFAAWREAHTALGVAPGTLPLPAARDLAAALPGAELRTEQFSETHADARGFLHAVKAIGAGTPAPGHRPLGPGTLRQVMRRFEQQGCTATYEVVTVLWQRPVP